MTKPLRTLCLVVACTLLAPVLPARAAGDDMKLGLCKQVIARMLCKKTSEFGYVGKLGEDIYILAVFYATKNSEYLCAVSPDGQVVVQDRTWRAMRRVMHYEMDSDGKCLTVAYSSPECPVKAPIKICPPKMDGKEAAKETFWNRPIPTILDEEFRAMREAAKGQANGTAPAPAAPPEAPGK
jgi:hypothetical protein